MNLIVVAHPDDEILGFGGTGSYLSSKGEKVQPVILSGEADKRKFRPKDSELLKDLKKANKIVGFQEPILGSFPNIEMNIVPHIQLVKFIEDQIIRFQPEKIFTHHSADLNDDHKQISNACMAAFRLFQRRDEIKPPKSLYFMEISSATDWSLARDNSVFHPDVFFDITETIELKIKALNAYRNVMRKAPHPRSEHALKSIAAYRGSQCKYLYAEAFQLVFQRGF